MIKKLYAKIFKLADRNIVKKRLSSGLKTPSYLKEELDIVYGGDSERNRVDIYYLKKYSHKKLPTIINIHGGGYVAGSKENLSEYSMKLAEQGYFVLNMEYTLSEQEGFPKPVFEVFDLFQFLEKNKDIEEHIDYDHLFLAGDSAGGHIASTVANIQCNPSVKEHFRVSGGPKISGLILNSPVFGAFRFGNLPIIKRDFEEIVFGKYAGSKLQRYCQNLDILTDKFPPTIIFSANNDFIRIHDIIFCRKAEELGLDVQSYNFVTGKHLGHDFIIYNLSEKEGLFALEKIKAFISDVINDTLPKGVIKENVNLRKKPKTNVEVVDEARNDIEENKK